MKIFSKQFLLGLIFSFVAIFSGIVASGLVDLAGKRYGLLLALPAVLVIALILLLDKTLLLVLIVFSRASLDHLLDTTKFAGIGLGGLLNVLMVLIGLLALYKLERPLKKIVLLVWLPFLTMYFYGVVISPEKISSFRIFINLLSTAGMFAVALYVVKTREDFTKWLKIIFCSCLIPIMYGVVTIIRPVGYYLSEHRLASTFAHPNILAFYSVLMILVGFYLWKSQQLSEKSLLKKLLPFIVLAMVGMLLLTQTRSAWVAFFAFFTFYALFIERKYIPVLLVLPVIGLAIPEIRDRVLDLTSGNQVVAYAKLNSYAWRKYLWDSALHWMQVSKYLTGYGADAFLHYSPMFFPLSTNKPTAAHNVYVQTFFDLGIFGTLAYIWLFLKAGQTILKNVLHDKLLKTIALISIASYLMYSYSDNLLGYLNFNWYFWFFLGATIGWQYRIKPVESPETSSSSVMTASGSV
jgi:O-antigen ligase